ncbi:MAG TPA: hypothetical protein VGL70_18520 [Candidatus Binatia bacterium]
MRRWKLAGASRLVKDLTGGIMKNGKEICFLVFVWIACFLIYPNPERVGGGTTAPSTCGSYNILDAKARAALATGYLEGVQAAVDKEARDMLVPPEDQDHPIWWVLPAGEITADHLGTRLTAVCRSKANENKKLLDAFLGLAARKDGFPRIGLPLNDGPTETWRTFLSKCRLRCSNYLATDDAERAHLIYGYYLGTSALTSILKTSPELSLTVWPDADYRDVNMRINAACREERYANSTIRDVLWLTTAEMGVEKRLAGGK